MDSAQTTDETVFQTTKQRECLEARLVLVAVGIPADSRYQDGWWSLLVSRDDLARAAAELEDYRHENPHQSHVHNEPVAVYGGATAGVLSYAGTIALFALLAAQHGFDLPWLSVGRMQAGRVMGGEWWRTVTALTLHLDAVHLTSNLIMGGVFGLLAGRILGGGIAWLAIVLAGTLGNAMNAVVQSPGHTSIGASTAVFAALGVLVSHALRPRPPVEERFLRRWSPLIGGILLLAFTGVGGERTDVMAHVTGFLAGLLLGWLGCRLPTHWLASRSVQTSAGMAAVAIVFAAWAIAVLCSHQALP